MLGVGTAEARQHGRRSMRKQIGSHRTIPDGSYEGMDRNRGVLIDCFHEDRDGDEHVDASHTFVMAGNRYLPPRADARLSEY